MTVLRIGMYVYKKKTTKTVKCIGIPIQKKKKLYHR